jgi:hypothetical protein
MVTKLRLPGGKFLFFSKVEGIFRSYVEEQAAAIDLYDRTMVGPHDEVLAIDILALNALNAFQGGEQMTPMTELWAERTRVSLAISEVTTKNLFFEPTKEALRVEQGKLIEALNVVDGIKWFGGRTKNASGTRTAKLLHRLRPNIAPVWDIRVGGLYQGGAAQPWKSAVPQIHDDIWHNRDILERIRKGAEDLKQTAGVPLSLLRVWDIILWKYDTL